MFEHIQQRNRSRLLVPVLALAGICIVGYFIVDRWSRSSSEHESISLFERVAAAKIAAEGRLERVRLPGMSISLPGEPLIAGDYVAGSAQYNEMGVGWTPGHLIMDLEFEQQQFKSFGGGYQKPEMAKLDGSVALEEHVGDTQHILASSCGRRTVILYARASREQYDKIKASFECKPERDLLHIGVVIAAPKGWKRTTDDPSIHLENATGDIVTVGRGIKESSMAAYGIPVGAKPQLDGLYRIWRGEGTGLDGKPRHTAIVDWPCAGQKYRGSALIVSKTSVDAGIELAFTGRCIPLDDPLPADLSPPK